MILKSNYIKPLTLLKSLLPKPFLIFVLLLPLSYISKAQFYNGSQMDFGKNRIQYDEPRLWTWYKFEKFDTYFYKNGREIAEYVSRNADKEINDIEKLFDFKLEAKIQFIIYNKQSEFKQSNLGLVTEEQYNIGGVTRIMGTKVMLYFEGDHSKLNQQMRAGIAEVIINQMMYGGNIKEMLRNSTFLNLPPWYVEGLVSYVTNKWDVDIDNRVRDGIITGKYKKFNRLLGEDAIYAGHSIWAYIADVYGESVLSNILYMTKVSRSVESSFMFVLGTTTKLLTAEWMQYYKNRYAITDSTKTDPSTKPLLLKPRVTRYYNQLKISPDGNSVIYATNEMGQYKVWLYNFTTNKTKRILKRDHKIDRINDHSYPLLTWHPSGQLFATIIEEKGELRLMYYNMDTHKKDWGKLFNFEKVLDFSYSGDGKKFVLSGVNGGQSDIYVYNIAGGSMEQITKDLYDDLTPRFIRNSSKIVFASNRANDTINLVKAERKSTMILNTNKDLYLYDYNNHSRVLKHITNTPDFNESNPVELDSNHISYLADNNGIRNRYTASFDSTISFVDTSAHYRFVVNSAPVSNYSRNILEHDVNKRASKLAQILYKNGKYWMYIDNIKAVSAQVPIQLKNTAFREKPVKAIDSTKVDSSKSNTNITNIKIIFNEAPKTKKDTSKNNVDINNYIFEDEKNKASTKTQEVKENTAVDSTNTEVKQEFKFPAMRNYNVFYATDYVVTQVDNTFLNSGYQRFTGGGPVFLNPGFTGLFKIGMSDLFEDYRIVGGMRLSGDLSSNEYFISYENRLHRVDRQLIVHRQAFSEVLEGNSSLYKQLMHEARYILRYPFSEVASLRGSLNIRNDRIVYLATDYPNLTRENIYEYWASAKLEYVFDNTIKRGLNLYNGLRYKLFAEFYKQVNRKETDITILGFDFRQYQKIHRDIILASRFAGSTSLGSQKLIYYMGGVDNWLLPMPKFDPNTTIDYTQKYAYQTLATNMRGFDQNVRNGNSFLLINEELRIPLFKYLLNRPIRSDFINNFQIIAFGDLGTAWNGLTPYSSDNSLNTQIINKANHKIILKTHVEPIIGGYGFGLRSRILGYFVRADWAWGVENRTVLPRVFYLSLSLDF